MCCRPSRLSPLARLIAGVWVLLAITGHWSRAQLISSPDEVIEVEPLYQVHAQPVEERRWVEVELEEVFSLSEGEEYFLYNAWRVRVDSTGHIYVLDRADRRVKKFDQDGDFVMSMGGGRGRGPGEFLWPFDFTVAPDGEVWVIDSHRRNVTLFSPDGGLVESFNVNTVSFPNSVAFMGAGSSVVLAYGPPFRSVFRTWSRDGTQREQFGTLLRNQTKTFSALSGTIRRSPGGFLFAPNRASELLRFAADSTLRYAVETMDEVPYPKVGVQEGDGGGGTRLIPVRRFSTRDLAVANGKIYCYSVPASTSSKRIIDVYRYSDGQYRYSFEVSGYFQGFEVDDDSFITLGPKGGVTVSQMERTTFP